jgi:hypothetical protein
MSATRKVAAGSPIRIGAERWPTAIATGA